MARTRIFGSDLPFCDWLRHEQGLPASSQDCGFVATDVDLMVHRYMSSVDGHGTREIQGLMHLEVKTRGGRPGSSQLDTLFKAHCRQCGWFTLGDQSLCHFGVSFVSMDGTHPRDSRTLLWGRFTHFGSLRWRSIDLDTLVRLLRFDIDPDTFHRISHHRDADDNSIVLYEAAGDGESIPTHLIKGGTDAAS